MAFSEETYILSLKKSKSYTDTIVQSLGTGMHYKGAVSYFKDLPTNASVGDSYSVKFQGESGTTSNGAQYVYATYNGTNQWIKLGPEVYRYATIPTPQSDLLGTIVQYVGVTTATYIGGYFYKCSQVSGGYTWEQIDVQPSVDITSTQSQIGTETYEHIFKDGNKVLTDAAITDKNGAQIDTTYVTNVDLTQKLSEKQETLVSGENIKTINSKSILGQGNVDLTYTDVGAAKSVHTHTVSDITNFPTIPTKTSQLTNDSGFLTQHQDISGKQDKLTAGTDISISADNVISYTGTSGPEEYLKTASVEGKTLKLTDQSGTQISFTSPTVPTKISEFENDAGYLTSHQSLAAYRTSANQDIIDDGKVDKIDGKGLSTNDYDNSAKAKVDAIPENPKYTDTTYSAGTGISIDASNVISATAQPSVLTSALTSEVAIGSITVGKTFPAGTSIEEIIRQMLTSAPTPSAGKIYFAITDNEPSMEIFNNPGANDQVESETVTTLKSEYTHTYTNGTSESAQNYSFSYTTSLGTLVSILDGINVEQKTRFTEKTDGDYTIWYISDMWTDVGMKFIFKFNS